MQESKLRAQSLDFAVSIINLVKSLKSKHETIISNQIGRSGTSIGATPAWGCALVATVVRGQPAVFAERSEANTKLPPSNTASLFSFSGGSSG